MEQKNNIESQKNYFMVFIENCVASVANIYERIPKWTVLIFSFCLIGYVVKREIDIEHHDKDVAKAAISFFSALRSGEDQIKEESDQKIKNEIYEINNGFILMFIGVSSDSIVSVYNKLTAEQKDIVKWANQRANKAVAHELQLKN